MQLDRRRINGAAHIRQRRQLLKPLRRFYKAAARHRYFNEFGVKLGGEKAGDHVCDLGN